MKDIVLILFGLSILYAFVMVFFIHGHGRYNPTVSKNFHMASILCGVSAIPMSYYFSLIFIIHPVLYFVSVSIIFFLYRRDVRNL